MKHGTLITITWLILVGGLLGCVPTPTPTTIVTATSIPTPTTTVTATPTPTPVLNLLIEETQGKVSIKREGWSGYAPVSFGAELRRGDLIRPEEGQAITILCADLTLHTIKQESGLPCKVEVPVLQYGERRLLSPRPEDDQLIPYILDPRKTNVLDAQPLLRWYDTGAQNYTVSIINTQSGKPHWSQPNVPEAKIRYPDNAPALQPNQNYLLEIQDSEHNSREEGIRGLHFQVVNQEEREEIKAQREKMLRLEIDEPKPKFALAVYYAGLGVRGEASDLLLEISPTLNLPHVHLLRGDLLLAMQLSDDAASAYQIALESANKLGDLESQAAAQAGLWRATKDEAHFNEAIELCEELGDQSAIDALHEELGNEN